MANGRKSSMDDNMSTTPHQKDDTLQARSTRHLGPVNLTALAHYHRLLGIPKQAGIVIKEVETDIYLIRFEWIQHG